MIDKIIISAALVVGLNTTIPKNNIKSVNYNVICTSSTTGDCDETSLSVRRIISNKVSVPLSDVKPESLLVDDLAVDSITKVEIIMKLEDTFSIVISDEDAIRFQTVKDIITFVCNHS